MSEDDSEHRETPSAGQDREPPVSGVERLFVRVSLWQTVLSVVGVFIAVIALYAALKESAAVRQQTAAAVWPFVQLLIEDFDTGDDAGFAMSFENVGVGPARLHAVRLELDGRPVRDWADAVAAVGGEPTANVSRNFVAGRVLRPDETVDVIRTMDADLARRLQSAVGSAENYIVYCYCSIFDECWLADSRGDIQRPEPVESCPDFGDASYGG